MKRLRASSIAEVLIAVTVIAICFGIASLVVIRSLKTTSGYSEFAEQTEIQSDLMQMLVRDTLYETEPEAQREQLSDSVAELTFLGTDDKLIWQQELISHEKEY